jgi:hypothetical protein
MRTRAERRHAQAKAKVRALKKVKDWFSASRFEPEPALIGKATNTRTLCSCGMCGNPRYGRNDFGCHTMQERRQLESEKGDW